MRNFLVILVLSFSAIANAESGIIDGGDDLCTGFVDAGTGCMYSEECGFGAICLDSECVCTPACGNQLTVQTCDDDGCWCTSRPACATHSDCSGGVCVLERCIEESESCESVVYGDFEEQCEGGSDAASCTCEPTPFTPGPSDAGSSDGGSDASTTGDAGTSTPTPDSDAGCSAAPGSRPAPAALFLLLAGMFLRRRR